MSQKLSIILRGHIRNSFNDNVLYSYIKQLSNEYDVKIYIQTWNIIQSDVSWRHLEKNASPVTESLIATYFSDLSNRIQKVIILDDTQLNIIGKTTGRMGKTAGSYLGWKRMWYGKYEIASYLKNVDPEPNHFIINTRFDVFNNSVSFSLNSINDKLKIIMNSNMNPSSISKNLFLKDVEFFGMDNFYIGNVNTILKLAERFNYQLDEIVIKYPRVTSHEFYTYHVNNTLFLDKWTNANAVVNMTLDSQIQDKNNIKNLNITAINPTVILDVINQNPVLPQDSNNKNHPSDKQVNVLNNYSHGKNNKIQLFDNTDIIHDPAGLMTSDDNRMSLLQPSSHGRNNKIQLFDKPDSINDQPIFMTSEANQIHLLNSSTGRNNRMQLFDMTDGVNNDPILITSDTNTPSLLQPSSYGRNNRMQLLDKLEVLNDQPILTTNGVNQIPILPSASHVRNNKMQLLDQSESVKNTVLSSIATDVNQIPILPSASHVRNNKMQLLDQSESVKNAVVSSIVTDVNQIPILPSASHVRNNKMPLMEMNSSLITSTIVNTTKLSTLPSSAQNKNGNKMELFDSNTLTNPNKFINNNENQSILVSTSTTRRGSVPLIDSSIKNNNFINIANNDIPILSSNSQTHRSTKPLINIDRNDKLSLNVPTISDMVLLNSIIRNGSSSMVNVKEQPIPVIEKPIPVIEKPIPVIETTIPVIETTIPVIEKVIEKKYKKNETKYINKPIPISKFSVSLDPNYLSLSIIGTVSNVLNISDNTKLIHSNKFKTNTQSFSAYYALLSQ